MSFMEQKQIMFEGSVGENLKVGLGDEVESDKASDEAMKQACLSASAWSDLTNLARTVYSVAAVCGCTRVEDSSVGHRRDRSSQRSGQSGRAIRAIRATA